MRTKIATLVSSLITSSRLRTLGRRVRALKRRLAGRRPVIHYFHQAGDPYSALAIQAVPLLRARYDADVEIHAVSPPDMAAAPEPDMLKAYGLRDAGLSARLAGFPFDADLSALAPDANAKALAEGDRLRKKLGHYLGAVFYFEGEWYWGLDRLDFLEERLQPFRRADAPGGFIAPRREVMLKPVARAGRKPVFEAFISFRSPYTSLAIERVTSLPRITAPISNGASCCRW